MNLSAGELNVPVRIDRRASVTVEQQSAGLTEGEWEEHLALRWCSANTVRGAESEQADRATPVLVKDFWFRKDAALAGVTEADRLVECETGQEYNIVLSADPDGSRRFWRIRGEYTLSSG